MTPRRMTNLERLTPRQVEILRLYGEGLSFKDIAQQLGLSYQTVKNTAYEAIHRLGVVNSRAAWALIRDEVLKGEREGRK